MPSTKPGPTASADSAAVFRIFARMWETGDLGMFDQLIAVHYIGHVAAGDRDRDGLRERIRVFRKTYPVMRIDVQDQFLSGDRVASRMLATGKDAQGKPVELMGLNIARIHDGMIEEEWTTWEALRAVRTP